MSNYRIPEVEKWINRAIRLLFYYRLVFVLLSLVGVVFLAIDVWHGSPPEERLRNIAVVFTAGSIVIGIFYSILNYEHTRTKFEHDIKASRENLTFNTAAKMHDITMITHMRNIKNFHNEYRHLFEEKKYSEIDRLLLNEKTEVRTSFIVTFNFFETIALGVHKGMMDEEFIREFFKTIFRDYFSCYAEYIDFLRKKSVSDNIFKYCTELAQTWKK